MADNLRGAAIQVEETALTIRLSDGRIVRIPWECCSSRLAHATAMERGHAQLSPSGYGIHWPLIDEDLSIRGLLKIAQECGGA